MIYQEKFDLNKDSSSYFAKQFDVLITGFSDGSNVRHNFIRENLKDFKGAILSLDTCENAIALKYSITNSEECLQASVHNIQLIPGLQQVIKKYNLQGQTVCIDITSLKHGVLFLLIKILLKEIKPSKLFAAYTEPVEYNKRKTRQLGEPEEFDLYERIVGSSNGVPGYIKHQSSKPILLLAAMGFDSQRLQTIYESIKPTKIIPIVGFPSFVPGWNITAINMNFMVIKNADCCDWIKRCESSSPFEMYELLEEEFFRYSSDFDIYISPLGTRPHCLGAAIFATKFPNTYLIYDFPIEKQFRSSEILKANIYNLSKYIT